MGIYLFICHVKKFKSRHFETGMGAPWSCQAFYVFFTSWFKMVAEAPVHVPDNRKEEREKEVFMSPF